MNPVWTKIFTCLAAALFLGACSVERIAVNKIGDALSSGGGVYLSDEDPELVKEAIPFGLKTYESLLEISPEHEGLLLASASGFTAYAYMLQQEADLIDAEDYKAARKLRARASKLYIRGRNFALRGLELEHPRFLENLTRDPGAALAQTTEDDIAFLYWGGAAWAGALTAAKDDPDLIAGLPYAAAMVGRVLELDETFENGAAHEFFVGYEAGRAGGDIEKAKAHYEKALQISGGKKASLYLSYAESISVQEQNLAEFRRYLEAAQGVELDAWPQLRLVNTLAQERAEWLENSIPDLFLDAE